MSLAVEPEQIDAIIFDFGGVLYNIDYNLPVRAFRDLGLKDFDKIFSQSQQNKLLDDLEIGIINESDFLKGLREYFDTKVNDEALLKAWDSILIDIPKRRIDAIHRLRKRYRTFLLSNTNELHVRSFEKEIEKCMGKEYFKSAFESIYYSNELHMRKPDAGIFNELMTRHQLNPARTLFIDDTERHVNGAKAAGINGYLFQVGRDEVEVLFEGW